MNNEPTNELDDDADPVIELVNTPPRSSLNRPHATDTNGSAAAFDVSPDGSSGSLGSDADTGDGDGGRQLLPGPAMSTSSHPPTRFNTAAPVAPPRPNPSGAPPRASNVPPAPRLTPSQTAALTESQEQLDLARRTLATRDAEIRVLLTQRDARIGELESLRSQLAAREFALKELEFAVLARETKIRDLEKEIEALQRPGEAPGDDLQLIRGIGRGFERELKKLGVRTFEQIAAWTTADVEEIAPQIKVQPDRIRRDGWVEHASELAASRHK